jgi:cytolysin (calcineurin-like family phosphatase)
MKTQHPLTNPNRRTFLRTGLTAAAATTIPSFGQTPGKQAPLAFFIISDTHVTAPENAPDTLDPHVQTINRRLIDLLNSLPGTTLPESMGGGLVRTPRGVLHLGDMIDSGDKGESPLSIQRRETEWKSFTADFGLTGNEGRLKFPIYEVHGNHDSVSIQNNVINGIISRNKLRPGVTHISKSGLHYSWDWNGVHFIALGIVVGHNDKDLPIGRYKAYDSLQFLKLDLETRVPNKETPVILFHHIDLLRYTKPCGPDSEKNGEWSACDVTAYHETIRHHPVTAIFHGHLHALRTEHWNGKPKANLTEKSNSIPVFGSRASGAHGANRGLFYCLVENGALTIREYACLNETDGWKPGTARWENQWTIPLHRKS